MEHFTYNRKWSCWLIVLTTFLAYILPAIGGQDGLFAPTSLTLSSDCSTCPKAILSGITTTPLPNMLVPICGTVVGIYNVSTSLTVANIIALSHNVIAVGTYSINTTITNGMPFSGSGSFSGTGTQNVTLTASGTPLTSGTTYYISKTWKLITWLL